MRRSRLMPACLAALAALAAGCISEKVPSGGPSASGPSVSASEASPTESSAPSPSATGSTLAGPACEPKSGGERANRMYLVAVRIAPRDGYDRIVWEFAPAAGAAAVVPGYVFEFAAPPFTHDPSGKPVEVQGTSFVKARFDSSRVDLSGSTARETYSGSLDFKPSTTRVVAEVREAGDFEHVMNWIAGSRKRTCYKVTTLTSPVRVVLDVSWE